MKTCPNCGGRDTRHWPLGRCTLCRGRGWIWVPQTVIVGQPLYDWALEDEGGVR